MKNEATTKKLMRLESLADNARAQLRSCADELRKTRDEHHALERHQQNQIERGFKLSAPDQKKLANLADRVNHLSEQYEAARAEHRAKRDLLTNCKEFSHG